MPRATSPTSVLDLTAGTFENPICIDDDDDDVTTTTVSTGSALLRTPGSLVTPASSIRSSPWGEGGCNVNMGPTSCGVPVTPTLDTSTTLPLLYIEVEDDDDKFLDDVLGWGVNSEDFCAISASATIEDQVASQEAKQEMWMWFSRNLNNPYVFESFNNPYQWPLENQTTH